MAGPILKLVINKGPREGETIVSDATSKIRIGRVIKGNTFSIRDSGISQKHILIEFNGVNWTISDLDSSNGTFLNENQIEAMKAFNLSDGDNIKIGEKTSILVKIEVKNENSDLKVVETQPRRNPPRQKRGMLTKDQGQVSKQKMSNSVASSFDKQEHEAPGLDARLDAPADRGRELRSRGAKRKAGTMKNAVLVHQVEDHPESSNLLSGSHGAEEKVAPEAEATLEAPVHNPRVTRQRRAKTMAAAKRDAILAGEVGKAPENLKSDHVKEMEQMAGGREAESSAHLNDCGIPDHQGNDTGGGENESISTSSYNANGGQECQGSGGEANDRLYLEKMTLGEWFDRMEKYLPKRINEIADEIIAKLRKRQKQFDEYVSEHNKEIQ